jgi:glycosyltransferase involved in cell wall biosynthesis
MGAVDSRPALSVVVVSFNSPALLARCLASLVEQAAAHNAEVMVVRAIRTDDLDCDAVRERFDGCCWLISPSDETVPRMRCQGISAARGAVVALIEDDCDVDERWCAAVLEAHRGPWVAVGGAVEPGSYTRALDWAVYLYEYGRFMLPFEAHESAVLPGNNISYKRDALSGEGLVEDDGFYDVFVHDAWRLQGLPMMISPTLVVTNRNSWSWANVWVTPFHHGRGFAAKRVAGRSWSRRCGLALLAPFLPLLQICRIVRLTLERNRLGARLALAGPGLAVFGASWALGEFVGYLLGPGKSVQHWR